MRLHPDPEFDRLLLRAFSVARPADRTAIEGAAHIASGDVVAWARYWRSEGDRALGLADARLASDDVSGAGRSLLSATSAYGLAAIGYASDPGCEAWRTNRAAQVAAFRAAMPLLPVVCEVVDIDAGTAAIYGYLFHGGVRNAPCVLIPYPADEFAEDGYTRYALEAADAGLNCLILEFAPVDGREALGPAITWARRSGLASITLLCSDTTAVQMARDTVGLDAIVCLLDGDFTASGVLGPLPDPHCPVVVLPRGSPVDLAFAWIARRC